MVSSVGRRKWLALNKFEGLRAKVGQPDIKYWKVLELHNKPKSRKLVYIQNEHMTAVPETASVVKFGSKGGSTCG